MSSMSFTCISCRVAFGDAETQRDHYRTDWHRYNMKRKVAQLPPVTAETFRDKVLTQQQQKQPESGRKDPKGRKKAFKKSPAVDVSAQKQAEEKPVAKELDGSDGGDEAEECEAEPIEVMDCLFCAHHSQDMEDNVKHMARSHSFFLPDIEFLCNLKGLLEYLGAKVGTGNVCLWCVKPFRCLEAVQQHMVDRGHSLLNYDPDSAEFVNFYDYRSSYPDFNGEPTQSRGEASGGEEEEEEEVTAPVVEVADNTGELMLPSGARAGHRSLQRYYKQSLRPSRMQVASVDKIQRLITQYKAIGWAGSAEVVRLANEKRRRDGDANLRRLQQQSAQVGWKANKLQSTFRRRDFLW